jgi:predicted dehydrogenase
MNAPIRWGVLSTANIAVKKVIPAMQQGLLTRVDAIASRDGDKAALIAAELGIPKAYSSYEDLLSDPDIDAVYNPLPNDLHVPWTIKALQAGKHVLCEKPIALDSAQGIQLAEANLRYPDLRIMEAFMYRFHPQWLKAKSLVTTGALGDIKAIHSFFSYFLDDPDNIRNQADMGGGGLMDIGCYCISYPRFLLNQEPKRVISLIDIDPKMRIDRLCSGLLDFGAGIQVSFTCGTQISPFQRVSIFGTEATLEMAIPANAPAGASTRLWLHRNNEAPEEILIPPSNQYTLQGDAFARAVIEGKEVPTPLSDALKNMAVIDALFRSAKEARWITL